MFDIIIRKSDEIRLLFDRRIVSGPEESEAILAQLRSVVPTAVQGGRVVIVDYETEYVSENFDTGFGIELTGKCSELGGFQEKVVHFPEDSAGLVCKAEEYEDAVRALHQYVLDNNYQIVGPVYQIRYEDGTVEVKLPVVNDTGVLDGPRDTYYRIAVILIGRTKIRILSNVLVEKHICFWNSKGAFILKEESRRFGYLKSWILRNTRRRISG